MKHYLQRLASLQSLNEAEMQEAVKVLFLEETSDSEVAAFLMGLKLKGETVEEVAGLVSILREKALPFTKRFQGVMDNCGTGGDGSRSFNISTTSAFVVAGAGIPVAKHGNRSISSKTGSADVLECLGVPLTLSIKSAEDCLEEVGISFLYAPHVHPKVGRIMKVRRELKIPTVFNLIGPLTNPVQLDYQLLGTYRRELLPLFAEVLQRLGRKRAIVVNGAGQMDEASLQGENHLMVVDSGKIKSLLLTPEDVDLPRYSNQEIVGGNPQDNAEILLGVLKGKKGAHRDTVLLNAGLAIYASNQATTIKDGILMAQESLDSGQALLKLQSLIRYGELQRQEGAVI